ncbi:hypothetical protein [Streptacidiphilus melanogenes]|nr:hypothetical protein [Streptacidiphilus melanogenes]
MSKKRQRKIVKKNHRRANAQNAFPLACSILTLLDLVLEIAARISGIK